jgi:hypothetical protein
MAGCFSCRARRFWRISGGWRKVRNSVAQTARRCLPWTRSPADNHIRAMLDPVEPRHFDAVFDATLAALEQSGGLAASRRLGGHVLIAFEYFRSDKLSCLNCSTRARAGGKTEHSTVATLVAPRPQPCPAAATRVRSAAERLRQAGLRKQGGPALARRPWGAAFPARSGRSRRRPLFAPADKRASSWPKRVWRNGSR